MLEVVCTFLAYTNLVFFQIMCTNTTVTEIVREWLKNFFSILYGILQSTFRNSNDKRNESIQLLKCIECHIHELFKRHLIYKYQHRRSLCLSTFSLQDSDIYLLKSILRIHTYACKWDQYQSLQYKIHNHCSSYRSEFRSTCFNETLNYWYNLSILF